ncbi:MAG: UDP-N-acetylmuramoyl-L-alanyl-D-glutamate--2,6-diaminopimelate ligase [Candidatus Ancillula sp.]|jgi:UDP-N-acetylmuramyl-tripeptide synthetase|nr:UDP-N-acetylmuramoyl-L-alanyl-D-glutamate--2,6-diaminopimelate ligase [Candidatus Ancillula sp.]
MKLSELFGTVDRKISQDVEIYGIKINSKDVVDGDLFVCTQGANMDRHEFINDAVSRGASAVVVSKKLEVDIPIVQVKDVNKVVDILFQKFYGFPQNALEMYAVTGTDGKTTTAWILQALLGNNYCGNIGTNGVIYSGHIESSKNTTPDSDKVYAYLEKFKNHGLKASVMEMSSEAIHYNRLQNLKFEVIGYTNVTSEHLNTHKTVENYLQAKITVFTKHLADNSTAILNADDNYCAVFTSKISEKFGKNVEIATYGKSNACTLQILTSSITSKGTDIVFKYAQKEYQILSPLFGDYNVYNLALALLMCISGGHEIEKILENIPKLHIPGRFELLDFGSSMPKLIVDFAHTPNAVKNILKFAKSNARAGILYGGGKIITVIGQPGERDAIKRPEVGKILSKYSDYAILTADDPRTESVLEICAQIASGISTSCKYEIVEDRHAAIKRAVEISNCNDIIMILGKGAERRQKIMGVDVDYNDIDTVYKIFGKTKDQ